MRCNLSGPLAAALLLSVASVPCPASWLDDTTHNVGVEAILAPKGTIDSGEVVAPRVVVANFGASVETVRVQMCVREYYQGDVYKDSLRIENLEPGARETVDFTPCAALPRDSLDAIAWTQCPGDTFPEDDTAKVRFLVRVVNLLVSGLWPDDVTLDSGAVIHPWCHVLNCSNVSGNFDIRFRIFPHDTIGHLPVYTSVRNINLIAGGATIVTAPDSWVAIPDTWLLVVDAAWHERRVGFASATFWVRGTIVIDVGVTRIWSNLPPDSIHVGDTVIVGMTVANFGVDPATFWAFFFFHDSGGGNIYAESSQVLLGPGGSTECEFPPYVFPYPGTYTVACSVYMVGDQNPSNDVKRLVMHVLPVCVEESPMPQATNSKPAATVVRALPPGAVVFDAMGRRSAALKSGIYFVRSEPSAANRQPSAVTVRKVILQR